MLDIYVIIPYYNYTLKYNHGPATCRPTTSILCILPCLDGRHADSSKTCMVASKARRERRQASQDGPEPSPVAALSVVEQKKQKRESATKEPTDTANIVSTSSAATEWDEDANAVANDRPAETMQQSGRSPGATRVAHTLFVGQLPYSAGIGDVRRHFKEHGNIVGGMRVRLLTKRDGGGSRGQAFVEFDSEADVHAALRLHKSPMDGRRINVERTVGGGGAKSAERQQKLSDLRDRQGRQMKASLAAMIEAVLPAATDSEAAAAAAAAAGREGGGEVEGDEETWAPPVCRDDIDERVLDFLGTVPMAVAEGALREAKALGMGGIRNRSAYLMGVLRRKVEEADKLRQQREQQRQHRPNKRGGAEKGVENGVGKPVAHTSRAEASSEEGAATKRKRDGTGGAGTTDGAADSAPDERKGKKARKQPGVPAGDIDIGTKEKQEKKAKKAKKAAADLLDL